MWVRGMTRAGHSGCQGGLSPVQTQRGNDSWAQEADNRRRLGERGTSTPSGSSKCTNGSAAPDAKRTLRTGSLRLIGDCALAAAGLRQGP